MAAKRQVAGAKRVARTKRPRAGAGGKPRVGAPVKSARQQLAKVQDELPRTLKEFSKAVRARLTRLERALERAEVQTRRQVARALREASHRLGRFEAEGERRWKQLTAEARKDALSVLRRMERALEAGKR